MNITTNMAELVSIELREFADLEFCCIRKKIRAYSILNLNQYILLQLYVNYINMNYQLFFIFYITLSITIKSNHC